LKRAAQISLSLALVSALLCCQSFAQNDAGQSSLGDLARTLRQKKAEGKQSPQPVVNHPVIDNDNLSAVMDEAETNHKSKSMLFSIDTVANKFQVSSPDVTCSLSFDAKATALLNDPMSSRDLPDGELAKLDGPATMDGNTLQISVFNGSEWNIREITVGLTVLRGSEQEQDTAPSLTPAGLLTPPAEVSSPLEKRSDVTYIFHLKGSAAPFATTVFREALDSPLGPEQDWHWSIIEAKGVPPKPLVSPAPTQTSKMVLP
jgi:hypothetical protein